MEAEDAQVCLMSKKTRRASLLIAAVPLFLGFPKMNNIGDLYCHGGSSCGSSTERPKSNAHLRGKLQLNKKASVWAPARKPPVEGMRHAMAFALLAECQPVDGRRVSVKPSYSTDIHFLARKLQGDGSWQTHDETESDDT